MYYNVWVKGKKLVAVKDILYDINSDGLNYIKIIGIWYGSKDYNYLMELLNELVDIELSIVDLEDLENGDKFFAKLGGVLLDDVRYHLADEDVTFYGTFTSYNEDLSVLESN